jgi:DNA-binding response OmpR family regulator
MDYSILVVEDEEAVRKNIVAYLQLTYKHIFEASNGYEAYTVYRKHYLDLIITDINMPRMDGLTLVEKIRKENNNLPIIMVSAYSDKDKLFRAVKLNLIDYIMKPISRKILIDLIEKVQNLEQNNEETLNPVVLGNGFVFETTYKVLSHRDEMILLTPQLTLLLEILVINKNRVLTSVDIFYHLHDAFEMEYSNGLVRNLVFKLRKIFPKEMIKNIYGGGYMLCVEE